MTWQQTIAGKFPRDFVHHLGDGKMMIANINTSEGHSKYIVEVYQEHYARLRHYFLRHLENTCEAEDCVQETINRFFFFMDDRDWEAEAEYISVYLMRIAGLICSRKLAEKRRQRADNPNVNGNSCIFTNLQTLVLQAIKEGLEFKQIFLRPKRATAD
jgi:DNA-directed RNA polymerase specialized sigma24 family protein